MAFLKNNWILILILASAFILRVAGIFYGYPLALVGDETPTLLASLKMIGTHSLRAATPGYYYPALLSYVYLPFLVVFLGLGWLVDFFPGVGAMQEAVFLNLGVFIPVIRFANVVMGTASVYLAYRIAFVLFDSKRSGLLAAWFLAVSFFHSSNSHFAQTWTPQTFFILLALYFSVKFYKNKISKPTDYICGGLLVGAAFGINFVGILSYFWFFLTHFLKNKGAGFFKIFIANKNFWLMNLALSAAIGLIYYLNPYGLNNYFLRIIGAGAPPEAGSAGYSSYKPFSLGLLKILWYYAKNTVTQEPIFSVLALAGSVFLWMRQRAAFYFLALWSVFYYLMVSPLSGAMGRYMLPVIPLFAIMAAEFTRQILNKASKVKIKFVWLGAVIISVFQIYFDVLFDLRMLKDDTRVLARNWILENIPSGSVVKNEDLGEVLSLAESRRSIELIKEKRPELFSTKRKYLLGLTDDKYPQPNYFLTAHPDLSRAVGAFDYVILGGFEKEELNKRAAELSESAILIKRFYPVKIEKDLSLQSGFVKLQFTSDNSLFKPLFLMRRTDYNGPYIEIYENAPNKL